MILVTPEDETTGTLSIPRLKSTPSVWYGNAVLSPCSDRTDATRAIAVSFGRLGTR